MSERVQVAAKKPEAKRETKVSQKQKTDPSQSISSPIDQILFLQRTIGNQAVGRLLKSGALQAKLRIGQPGDVYEQEADRVAEQVMRMPEPKASNETDVSNPAGNNSIQCKCLGCKKGIKIGKEEEEEKLQKKEASGSTPEVTLELESSISAIRGGGQPLPESARAFYEPRFGADFSQVRVHTDAKAAAAANAVNARAFTVGKDVVFGEGNFAPVTKAGRILIAHELSHVIQQSKVGTHCVQFQEERKSTQGAIHQSCKNIEFIECIMNVIKQKEAMIEVYTRLAKKWGKAYVNTESGERIPLNFIDFRKLEPENRVNMLKDLLDSHASYAQDVENETNNIEAPAGCGFDLNIGIYMYTDRLTCEINNSKKAEQAIPCRELFEIAQMHEVFHAKECEKHKNNNMMITPAGSAQEEIQAHNDEIKKLKNLLEQDQKQPKNLKHGITPKRRVPPPTLPSHR